MISTAVSKESAGILKQRTKSLKAFSNSEDSSFKSSTSRQNTEKDSLKTNFISWDTPIHKRLEILAIFWHCSSLLIFISACFAIYALSPLNVWLYFHIPYLIVFFFFKPSQNGRVIYRMSDFFRSLSIWKYLVDYFPIKIHKTVDLEPSYQEILVENDYFIKIKIPHMLVFLIPGFLLHVETITKKPDSVSDIESDDNIEDTTELDQDDIVFKDNTKIIRQTYYIKFVKLKPYKRIVSTGNKYIFGVSPHGIVALGATGTFGTTRSSWLDQFANIPVCLLTLNIQFNIPFYCDYLSMLGISLVTRSNIDAILSPKNFHNVAIVLGGAREALLARPGSTDIILTKRHGFIKAAMANKGTRLVPIYVFGENEVYDAVSKEFYESGKVLKFNNLMKKWFGFAIPMFRGRGLFNMDFGLLPYNKEINMVVGKPIEVPYSKLPSPEVVDHYLKRYIRELTELYESNKTKFGYSAELNIV